MSATSRIKKIIVWFLILVFAVGGLTAGGAGYYINKTNNKLADLISANPESTAVVAYTFDDEGEFVEDGHALFHNADSPLIMASTMKIVVLAAYAGAVAHGQLDPGEQIAVADWEKYYLPMTDGGSHVTSLMSLGIEVDDLGFALNQAATVSLDDLARFMIHYSENAGTDYLIARLGADQMNAVMQEAGLKHHTAIGPTLGFALAAFNHENPSFSADPLHDLIAEGPAIQADYLNGLVELYINDPQWQAAQIEFMASLGTRNLNGEAVWANQVMAGQLLPKGTASEYAQMMAKVASGKLISREASEIMQQKLESVSSDWPLRLLFYNRFGAKDGTTAGVLTLASYAVPKRGMLNGQSRVVVIITNQLTPQDWTEQVQNQGHYLLPIDLTQATGVFGTLVSAGNE